MLAGSPSGAAILVEAAQSEAIRQADAVGPGSHFDRWMFQLTYRLWVNELRCHAAEAMELGADAVLVNTAMAIASDPVRMGKAFKLAVESGRAAYEMGLPEMIDGASATSPPTGFLE